MIPVEALARPLQKGWLQCRACEHWCALAPGRAGRCGVRVNRGGQLDLSVYGRPAARHVDPIEKKPLHHFLPGTPILSVGTVGCSLACAWCQNWTISQAADVGGLAVGEWPPARLVESCLADHVPLLAFTYNEPAVFVEYARDTAALAARHGIRSVFVSSGFETLDAFAAMAPHLAAANLDLKAFRDLTYRELCGARLEPVLRNLAHLVNDTDVWVEVTTLVIPGVNDSDAELRDTARFLAELDPSLPWHVSAFHPDYRMRDRPPTPVATLRRAWDIGRAAGLHYVYAGNLPGSGALAGCQDTTCPGCGATVLRRCGFSTAAAWRTPGVCPSCGTAVAGVWT